jgi:aspartyl-tRNA(Asn)/glutamyl-tRNA(Gln) amidotransferase subunit B
MTQKPYGEWKPVIGLEIHAQLNTRSKMFSRAPNRFGDEPNMNITEVCTGQPGALPVLNKEAVRKAVQFGCAINGNVCKFSKFDRKSYFYPDSPRNFQITQFDQPIVKGGRVVTEVDGVEQTFAVNRVHLEDDAGMLKHFTNFAGVDYNRAGVPLIEIVSEPCIHSPQEAVAYAMAVKAILEYLDASDCNMEEGSLRFDANVSVMKEGESKLRNKIEIKNMNSFSNMELAVEAEIHRQIREYTRNKDKPQDQVIEQATYRWDPDQKCTVLMRRKEDAEDYRYFPEPDLVPIILTDAYINEIRESLPELPLQRERRYVQELGLPSANAFVLTSDKKLADYFEEALEICPNARNLCNWIIVEFAGRLKDSGKRLPETDITAANVGRLVNMIEKGTITGRMAKEVADLMIAHPGKDSEQIVKENPDFQPLHDKGAIEPIVTQVISENEQSVNDYRAGKEKAFAFLVGQVMKQTRGKASPDVVNALLKEKLKL